MSVGLKNRGKNDDNVGNARHAGNGRHDGRCVGDSRDAPSYAYWCFGDSSPSAANHFSSQKNSAIKSGSIFGE